MIEICPVVAGLNEALISRNPREVLVAYGLGSCVGVGMYDPVARVGGLLHAVLPEHKNGREARPAQYVDSGIPWLAAQLQEAGANPSRLEVFLTGGANMLAAAPYLARRLNIGDRNIRAAYAALSSLRLKIRAEAVGGAVGRTMRLYIADGRVTVRVIGGPERNIFDVKPE